MNQEYFLKRKSNLNWNRRVFFFEEIKNLTEIFIRENQNQYSATVVNKQEKMFILIIQNISFRF